MLKIRRSHNRLIFNMGIPIPWYDSLYIETGPCYIFQLLLLPLNMSLWLVTVSNGSLWDATGVRDRSVTLATQEMRGLFHLSFFMRNLNSEENLSWYFILQFFSTRLLEMFTLAMKFQFSCHVQTFVAINVMLLRWEQIEIPLELEIWCKSEKWNGLCMNAVSLVVNF